LPLYLPRDPDLFVHKISERTECNPTSILRPTSICLQAALGRSISAADRLLMSELQLRICQRNTRAHCGRSRCRSLPRSLLESAANPLTDCGPLVGYIHLRAHGVYVPINGEQRGNERFASCSDYVPTNNSGRFVLHLTALFSSSCVYVPLLNRVLGYSLCYTLLAIIHFLNVDYLI